MKMWEKAEAHSFHNSPGTGHTLPAHLGDQTQSWHPVLTQEAGSLLSFAPEKCRPIFAETDEMFGNVKN